MLKENIWCLLSIILVVLVLPGCVAGNKDAKLNTVKMGIAGKWTGGAEIRSSWTQQKFLPIALDINRAGKVSGSVGDAVLQNGQFTQIRSPLIGSSEYSIIGNLSGQVLRLDHITRGNITLRFRKIDGELHGIAFTSGSQFGGKDTRRIEAGDLKLKFSSSLSRK
ncbi:hypothetical protein [Poriferisphaera sp. WC338]|uniref:hypothetical protein n=1 Tax=Poriferisphaera sp. WC338 TaxID=3425129 RepID=UPI003D816E25